MTNQTNDNIALYAQLLAQLREQILAGRLPEGSRLPSESELSDSFGISRGTVRQALGMLENEGLIERIKGSGSFVRQTKQQPSSQTDRQIGIVLSQQRDQLNMEILVGVEQGAKMRGYSVTFSYSEENVAQQRRDIERMKADGVRGLIIFPVGEDPEREGIEQLVRSEALPLVLVDRYFPTLDTDCVVADNYTGGYRATEHLLILGYRRIAFVYTHASSLQVTAIHHRWLGYRAALEHYGLAYDESLVYQRGENSSYDAFFAQPPLPDAVFATNDLEALAVLKAAQQRGLRVPDDIALVGFDDLNFAPLLHPPLTTISQPRIDVGLRASNLLIDRLEGLRTTTKKIELPTNLIVRESCGAKLQVKRSIAGD